MTCAFRIKFETLAPVISRPMSLAKKHPFSNTLPEPKETHVQFLDDEAKSGVLVACETSHPGGLMARLVNKLSDLELEVHQVESRMREGKRSERLWVSAPDGQPISQRRQALLRAAVFNAMETLNHEAAPPLESADSRELSAG